jgi:hypothetical protein
LRYTASGGKWVGARVPASALANAVARLKALKRGQPDRARALLDRRYARLGARRAVDDWAAAILGLADRAAGLEPAQAGLADRVRALVRAALGGGR